MTSNTSSAQTSKRFLLAGYGITNRAVATQLTKRGHRVLLGDDGLGSDAARTQAQSHAVSLGLELLERPSEGEWAELVRATEVLVPTPGLVESHPVFAAATRVDVPVISELDLAQRWDERPNLAVTGTNGKTTVTNMAACMLEASDIATTVAGNTDTPLIEAIDDPVPQAFVVEASSFRLGHSCCYKPEVAAWLNFAPDHLDVHASLDTYRAAKAAIWRGAEAHNTAIVNLDDPVVAAHAPQAARVITYGLHEGDFRFANGALWAGTHKLVDCVELKRQMPHDLSNLLGAAALAMTAGARSEAVRLAMLEWDGLAHRLWFVGEHCGVRYFDDSKATTPHAVCAAVRSLANSAQSAGTGKVVLIAGGRNKGLGLGPLVEIADALRAVVTIGEAAAEVGRVFAGRCPTAVAGSMLEAVQLSANSACEGDAVLLSPGCASFDWYGSYVERGEHFCEVVRELMGGSP